MFDRETGRSKGFAFATFADEESVPIAMNASGIELDGKAVCHASYPSDGLDGVSRLTHRRRSRSRKLNLEARVIWSRTLLSQEVAVNKVVDLTTRLKAGWV